MKSPTSKAQIAADNAANMRSVAGNAADCRIDAGWIITVDNDNRVLKNHSLIIANGRIMDCVPTVYADNAYSKVQRIDRSSCILIPGLINAHTHLPMNLLRGIGGDKPLQSWLNDHMWPLEAAHLSAAFVRDGTELALAECLLGGITTVNDMYYFPDAFADVCKQAGLRATVGLGIMDMPTPWAQSIDEYFDKALAVHDQLHTHPLINTALAPHAPYSVSVKALDRIAVLSAELDLPVHMHVHETATEVQDYIDKFRMRPLQRLHKVGLLSPSLLAVHLTQLTDEDISLLADSGANAIHCPESNLKLASGFCPVHKLISAGVNVAIGTDSAASNNDLDMLGETRTAALLSKAVSHDASSLPAAQALRMATINGARALGIDNQTGSLEFGKSADVACIEPDLTMLPMHDVLAQVVYSANRERISDVWVAGKHLLKQRQLQTLDAERISDTANKWATRLHQA